MHVLVATHAKRQKSSQLFQNYYFPYFCQIKIKRQNDQMKALTKKKIAFVAFITFLLALLFSVVLHENEYISGKLNFSILFVCPPVQLYFNLSCLETVQLFEIVAINKGNGKLCESTEILPVRSIELEGYRWPCHLKESGIAQITFHRGR